MAAQNLLGNLALDDSVILLRRIVKLLEASGNADVANRQRVSVDFITGGVTLGVSQVTNLGQIAGYDQRQFADTARVAYNTGIRQHLMFS